jgi:hypothetical protein
MDFIERLFHISPDGGSGSTEFLVLFVVVVAVLLVAALRKRGGDLLPRGVARTGRLVSGRNDRELSSSRRVMT